MRQLRHGVGCICGRGDAGQTVDSPVEGEGINLHQSITNLSAGRWIDRAYRIDRKNSNDLIPFRPLIRRPVQFLGQPPRQRVHPLLDFCRGVSSPRDAADEWLSGRR